MSASAMVRRRVEAFKGKIREEIAYVVSDAYITLGIERMASVSSVKSALWT